MSNCIFVNIHILKSVKQRLIEFLTVLFNKRLQCKCSGESSISYYFRSEDPVDRRIDRTLGRRGIPFLDWGIMRGKNWICKQPEGGP
jgi:hypothetical protein